MWDSGVWALGSSSAYCRSIRAPSRQTISHGIVPIAAAISRASICCHVSSPCRPMITTSSPGCTSSRPVTSTVIMSIETAPTIGTRRPRISTWPRPRDAQVEAVGVAGGHDGDASRGVSALEPRAVADALAGPQPLHGDDAAGQRHHRLQRNRRRQRRRHDAVEQQARAAPCRTTRASRAAAPRCWHACRSTSCGRLGRPARARSTVVSAASKRSRCSLKQRLLRDRPPSRSACRPPRAAGSGCRAARAACAAGCRGGTRAGSCRCRS